MEIPVLWTRDVALNSVGWRGGNWFCCWCGNEVGKGPKLEVQRCPENHEGQLFAFVLVSQNSFNDRYFEQVMQDLPHLAVIGYGESYMGVMHPKWIATDICVGPEVLFLPGVRWSTDDRMANLLVSACTLVLEETHSPDQPWGCNEYLVCGNCFRVVSVGDYLAACPLCHTRFRFSAVLRSMADNHTVDDELIARVRKMLPELTFAGICDTVDGTRPAVNITQWYEGE